MRISKGNSVINGKKSARAAKTHYRHGHAAEAQLRAHNPMRPATPHSPTIGPKPPTSAPPPRPARTSQYKSK